jgi:hypothetical protein
LVLLPLEVSGVFERVSPCIFYTFSSKKKNSQTHISSSSLRWRLVLYAKLLHSFYRCNQCNGKKFQLNFCFCVFTGWTLYCMPRV